MLELDSLHWYKTSEHPLRLRHFNRTLLVKYHSPTFPGTKSLENKPVHYASGKVICTTPTGEQLAEPQFVFQGIAGHPMIPITTIVEYIFL